jgi:hypothetical protein
MCGKYMEHHLSRITQDTSEDYDSIGSFKRFSHIAFSREEDFYKHQHNYSVLRADYYLSGLNVIDPLRRKVLIIVTNNIENARGVKKDTNPDIVLGPKGLNEWESLRLISSTKNLVTSNSTFFWWGGRIALASGAKIYIPSPWLKDSTAGVNNAFEHPNFKLVSSVF